MKNIVIAIDGTAASGKGTLARKLAARYGFAHLDTGKLYRAVGWTVLRDGGDPADPETAVTVAREMRAWLEPGDLAHAELETDEAGQAASKVAAIPQVRKELFDLQRDFVSNPPALQDGAPARGAVLDGRDIGTVVCPDAPVKFFVTATVEIRAERRFKELQSKGLSTTYGAVLADMRERDARDEGRETAPMKPAFDALILDTSSMTPDQVLEAALAYASSRLNN